jgi:hypothetical protein
MEMEYTFPDGVKGIESSGTPEGLSYVRPLRCDFCEAKGIIEGIGGRRMYCDCVTWLDGEDDLVPPPPIEETS